MELYQYSSMVRFTKGYTVLYESENMIISAGKKDPYVIITTRKSNTPELEHIRINKRLFR